MKMKPRVWDVMRQSKKDKITDHPSFDNLDALSKIDRGGLQLDEATMEFGKDKGMYDDDRNIMILHPLPTWKSSY